MYHVMFIAKYIYRYTELCMEFYYLLWAFGMRKSQVLMYFLNAAVVISKAVFNIPDPSQRQMNRGLVTLAAAVVRSIIE